MLISRWIRGMALESEGFAFAIEAIEQSLQFDKRNNPGRLEAHDERTILYRSSLPAVKEIT